MECHGLEMIGNFKSADGIDAIEIEAGTGKVIINNALDLDFGTPPVTAYNKVLTSDANGNATWQTKSIVKGTVMLFLMGTPPTGWTKNDTFIHYSMLIYRDPGMGFNSGGSDLPTFFTINTTTNTTGSDHTHTYSFDTAPDTGATWDRQDGKARAVRVGHIHTLSGPTYDTGSTHTHTMTTDTYSPKYQTIIAATKD
jgi:hypothetical protein